MPSTPKTNTLHISDKHKLLGLDHLRALAITLVFLFHYQLFSHPAWVGTVGSFGWTGVDLFFVLSGFLIAGQLFGTVAKGKPIPMREFFAKRFFRIIPPFLVVLGLYVFIPFLRERENLAPLWRYLTFTLNFGLNPHQTGTFTHAWSLCVEEQFYLILPVAFWLFTYFKAGKKAVYLLALLFIAGFAIRYAGWHYLITPYINTPDFIRKWNEFVYYPTYNRLDGLLIGVSIAGTYTFYPQVKIWVNKYSNMVMGFGLIVLVGAYIVCTPENSFATTIYGFPLVSLGYGLVAAAIVCANNIFYNFKSWLTAQIATLSYSIYLIHKMMINLTQNLLQQVGINKDSNLMMLCCVISSIAGALVLRYVVELPALRLRDRVLGRWSKANEPDN